MHSVKGGLLESNGLSSYTCHVLLLNGMRGLAGRYSKYLVEKPSMHLKEKLQAYK